MTRQSFNKLIKSDHSKWKKNFFNIEGLQMKHTSHPFLHQIQLARDLLLTDTSLTPNTFLPLVLYSSTLSNCYTHAAAAAKSLQ